MDDVLLVTVDSLRADRTGDTDRDTTPNLDRFGSDAVTYTAAHAHGPTTFTSFPSLLTGRHALENPAYPALRGETLAEAFADAGYHTLSVTSNAWLSPTYGYDRGFEEVHALGRGPRSATGLWDTARHRIGDALGDGVLFAALKRVYDGTREVTDTANEEDRIHELVTDHLAREEPTFTWAHYMTTHTPYTPDPEADPRFADRFPDEERVRELTERARDDPGGVPDTDRELLVDLYDEAVSHVDRRIGDLLDAVDLDTTAVAVTADHGEEFWDHGDFEHPPRLHQELLHVPLFLHLPDERAGAVTDPVGLDALGPTLRQHALDGDPENVLPPWGTDYGPVVSACAHAARMEADSASAADLRLAVRRDEHKYVRGPDGTERLYDLAADPGEATDVAPENEGVLSALADVADAAAARFEFGDGHGVPDHLEDRLADLGYVE